MRYRTILDEAVESFFKILMDMCKKEAENGNDRDNG